MIVPAGLHDKDAILERSSLADPNRPALVLRLRPGARSGVGADVVGWFLGEPGEQFFYGAV